jgi:hypothetical protein
VPASKSETGFTEIGGQTFDFSMGTFEKAALATMPDLSPIFGSILSKISKFFNTRTASTIGKVGYEGADEAAGLYKGFTQNPKTTDKLTSWVTDKILTRKDVVTVIDPVTGKVISNVITKRGNLLGVALIAGGIVSLISSYLGSAAWAGHLKVDTVIPGLQIAINAARKAGDEEAATMGQDYLDEILDPPTLTKVIEQIPIVNVIDITQRGLKAEIITNEIFKKIQQDNQIQIATGETEDTKWARLRQEEADQEKANVDYYNQQRMQLLLWEEEARDRDMQEDAAFWAAQQAKQRELEEADRQAIAKFWLEYRKLAQKISDDSRPSKLNFGLI